MLVWYASYGSNLHSERFEVYLNGGTPAGGRRAAPGCRDKRPPSDVCALEVPGGIFFATESLVWGGGRAFYDPELPGTAAMRAYLITHEQFSDVVAQEMYGRTGADLDLTEVLRTGRSCLGPGRYQTLIRLPHESAHPMITFTSPWSASEVPGRAPSAAYLRNLVLGLRQTQAWPPERVARYLAEVPGARGHWSAAAVLKLA